MVTATWGWKTRTVTESVAQRIVKDLQAPGVTLAIPAHQAKQDRQDRQDRAFAAIVGREQPQRA